MRPWIGILILLFALGLVGGLLASRARYQRSVEKLYAPLAPEPPALESIKFQHSPKYTGNVIHSNVATTFHPDALAAFEQLLEAGKEIRDHKCVPKGEFEFRYTDGRVVRYSLKRSHEPDTHDVCGSAGCIRVPRDVMEAAMKHLMLKRVPSGWEPISTESKSSADDERQENQAKPVLLTKGKRPRDPGGCQYVMYTAGFWGSVHSVAFSPDGRYLLSAGSEDGTVRLWDIATGEELRRYEGIGHSSEYASVAFSPDGRYVLAGSYKRSNKDPHAAWLFDIDTTEQIHRFVGHTTQSSGGVKVGFSPDGNRIVTACKGPAIVWDTGSGRLVRELGGHAVSAAFSPSGDRIVTGDSNGDIVIWEAGSGRQLHRFGLDGRLYTIEFSPDGERLFVRNQRSVVYLDARKGRVFQRISLDHATYATAQSPDGLFALIGVTYREAPSQTFGSGRAELYNLSTGRKVRTFERTNAFDGWIRAAAFSPNGQLAATGSNYGPVLLWDVSTGEQVRAFYGHRGRGPDVSFQAVHCDAAFDDGHVQIASRIQSVHNLDEKQCHWLNRICRQQQHTVGFPRQYSPFRPQR